MSPPICYVTRIESFSSAHRLHCQQLGEAENAAMYGPCNNPNGHGHNYKMEVTVKGPIDPVTGMVMNVTDLKKIIHEHVFDLMDHKHLDKDVPIFRDNHMVTTSEHVALVIFNIIKPKLPGHVTLHRVRVSDYEQDYSEIIGE